MKILQWGIKGKGNGRTARMAGQSGHQIAVRALYMAFQFGNEQEDPHITCGTCAVGEIEANRK
jgi:hypothetical protein